MGTCTTLMSNNNDNKWRMEEVEIQVQVDLLLVESWRSCVASRNAVWTGGLVCRKWVDRIQNSLLVSINQKYVYYKTRFYKKKKPFGNLSKEQSALVEVFSQERNWSGIQNVPLAVALKIISEDWKRVPYIILLIEITFLLCFTQEI